jgi:hypothetical protein
MLHRSSLGTVNANKKNRAVYVLGSSDRFVQRQLRTYESAVFLIVNGVWCCIFKGVICT